MLALSAFEFLGVDPARFMGCAGASPAKREVAPACASAADAEETAVAAVSEPSASESQAAVVEAV